MKKNNADNNIKLTDIKLPQDLKKLSLGQLNSLCSQIRKILITTVSKNGGHLASNLGTVELTVAIHRVFDAPDDKIVWDVGHQAYTHKILTGRLDRFSTLRQENGISGFPKPCESKYDSFISGHSSNSISAALGIASAMKQNGDNHYAVAVIGDGALTGGLAYEGLNNAGKSDTNIIIILNHNGMSISKNVGGLAKYLATLRTKQSYLKTKSVVEKVLDKTPVLGKPVKRIIKSSKSAVKNAIIQNSTMFEDFGFEFVGPVDGHNIEELEVALKNAKAMHRPVFVHVNTVKGKGYTPAELNPGEYHGIGKFEIATGNPDVVPSDSYSSEAGKMLSYLADSDNRIIAITAAMKYGTGLQYFTKNHKGRFYDVGIAEEHAITFSSGLASMGYIPVFCVYSSFLQRTYDEILHDCAIMNQHIVLCIDRAGIVGEDGETHQGLFDISFLTAIPGMTLYSPSSYEELRLCIDTAININKGIVGIRYPKGNNQFKYDNTVKTSFYYNNNNSDTLIVTYGRISSAVSSAIISLNNHNYNCDFMKMVKVFPIEDEIIEICNKYKNIFFFEETYVQGSIGEKMLYLLYNNGFRGDYYHRGINRFVKQATVNSALSSVGLDSESIEKTIIRELSNEKKA